jgi:hypothetical protein
MTVEEGEEIQTKGIDNLFNTTIPESFPNLKKESPKCRKLTEQQTIRTKRETPSDIIIKTLSTQNKGRMLKAAKEKRKLVYKDKPIRTTAEFSTQTLKIRRPWKDII